MSRLRGFVFFGARAFPPSRRLVAWIAPLFFVFLVSLSIRSGVAAAAELPGVVGDQDRPTHPADCRELFSWIDELFRTQPSTVARFEASVGAALHRIERNDWLAAYETSGSARPWVRRVELRLPEGANQGWSFFLILDLDPARVEILPSDAIAYRPGARIGTDPWIPPGWQTVGKYWRLTAPDFLRWESTGETVILRFRSEGPRRLAQCSLYRKTTASLAEGVNASRRGTSRRARSETGLGAGIDALLDETPNAAERVQSLQRAGWRLLWSPFPISAVDFAQRAILLPKEKNLRQSCSWLLWELGRIPRPLDSVAAASPAE